LPLSLRQRTTLAAPIITTTAITIITITITIIITGNPSDKC
jgi:hypothetical protein